MREKNGALCMERDRGGGLVSMKGEGSKGSWLRRMVMIPYSIKAAIDGGHLYHFEALRVHQ